MEYLDLDQTDRERLSWTVWALFLTYELEEYSSWRDILIIFLIILFLLYSNMHYKQWSQWSRTGIGSPASCQATKLQNYEYLLMHYSIVLIVWTLKNFNLRILSVNPKEPLRFPRFAFPGLLFWIEPVNCRVHFPESSRLKRFPKVQSRTNLHVTSPR